MRPLPTIDQLAGGGRHADTLRLALQYHFGGTCPRGSTPGNPRARRQRPPRQAAVLSPIISSTASQKHPPLASASDARRPP